MAWPASPSFSISTKAKPRERPVSRSVMIRALLTWPCRSKRLRTASSEALKSRLPTNMFFTLVSCQFESGGLSVRAHKRGGSRLHSAGFAEACQTRFEYNTGRKDWANEIGGKKVRSEEHTSELQSLRHLV